MARRRGWGGSPPVNDEEASQRIVSAAVDLIGRTGAVISIADVAESLGVIRQTVYRYFPSTDALLRAAAIASVGSFLDRLTEHTQGLEEPAEALVEAVIYTLDDVRRTPHLGIMLSGAHSHTEGITSDEAMVFGMTMIRRFDVDWERHGYDEPALRELVEYLLRTMQSFFVSPGNPPRSEDELRSYLRRWMGTSIAAQIDRGAAATPSEPAPGD
ncbi:TetR/AcrR family transcriptional regulator [Rhodococcus sp. ACT016]|uniref:TetR/AcrR family transcriptional regulator n=1 Tax=Rhodococcus sp. ACT016 TaxID=3134808 RepID=UPI003D2E3C26